MHFTAHPKSLVESEHVGDGTRIWAFAHVLPGARIERDCNICDQVFIEGDVTIGDRVTIKSGVQLWDGVRLKDDVFVGPNTTFTNDRYPRSKQYLKEFPETIVRRGASIGANATILPGLVIGRFAMIGAGSVVTRDVPPNAIVVGNPARIRGYVDTPSLSPAFSGDIAREAKTGDLDVGGARIIKLPCAADLRGRLSFGQVGDQLPFTPKRYFLVYDVASREVRGEHAHRELQQFLVCVVGSCAVALDDAKSRVEVVLDRPDVGLLVPPMVWATQYRYTPDAILLLLAT